MTFKILIENNLGDNKYKEASDQINDTINNNADVRKKVPTGEMLLVHHDHGEFVVNEEQFVQSFKNNEYIIAIAYDHGNKDFTYQKLKEKYKFIHFQVIENGVLYESKYGAPQIQLYVKSGDYDKLMKLALRKWINNGKILKKHAEEKLICSNGEYAIMLKN